MGSRGSLWVPYPATYLDVHQPGGSIPRKESSLGKASARQSSSSASQVAPEKSLGKKAMRNGLGARGAFLADCTNPADRKLNPHDSNNETTISIYSYSLSPVFTSYYKQWNHFAAYLSRSSSFLTYDYLLMIYDFLTWTKLHMDSNWSSISIHRKKEKTTWNVLRTYL